MNKVIQIKIALENIQAHNLFFFLSVIRQSKPQQLIDYDFKNKYF